MGVQTVLAKADDVAIPVVDRPPGPGDDIIEDRRRAYFQSDKVKYRFTVQHVQEALTHDGLRPIPGTDVHVQFEDGMYNTDRKSIVKALINSVDFGLRFKMHQGDPTGYWQWRGMMKKVVREVTEYQETLNVKRGAISVGGAVPQQAEPVMQPESQVEPQIEPQTEPLVAAVEDEPAPPKKRRRMKRRAYRPRKPRTVTVES